ncbi:complex I subunit 5 family protein [Chakrabartyella piscis]|uniref:complex I subunit 5 family protein n=1 Tax=Chakrabartyella piscis TaxID=2918914 RepID=UPI0029584423|nr:proton-conducting transporter membrane subunit [Chakrabartyella piscis]
MEHINWIHNLPFFSIFIAMFAILLTAMFRTAKMAKRIHMTMMCIVVILSAILTYHMAVAPETFTFTMGHYPAPWGNELTAGPLEALMALVFGTVMLLSVMGGWVFIEKDVLQEKQYLYYIMLDAAMGAMLALIYTNDIFTAYVFIEINTLAACALVLAKGTATAMVGATHYLIMGLLGSGLFLFGVSILYSITGHLLLPQIGEAVTVLAASGQYHFALLIATAFLFIALAIKSGLFPFHTWLPVAHPIAIPASSAILSGFVVKGYVIFAIKLMYSVFSVEFMHELGIIDILFVFGVLGMVFGSLSAMRQRKMKKILAYSSVAQIGYIYMGVGLGTEIGLTAACFHMIAHGFTKSMLFLCAGSFVKQCGNIDDMDQMRGIAYKNPVAGIGYTIGAMSMIGIPLLAGFISKLYFATASIFSEGKMAASLLVLGISMILNALYFLPSVMAIWTTKKGMQEAKRANISPWFITSIVLLLCINVGLGVWYQPVIELIEVGLQLLQK